MEYQLLRIRYYQLKRDLGFWVFLLAGLAGLIRYSVASTGTRNTYILTGVIFLIIWMYHRQRKDLNFAGKIFAKPRLQMLVNYQLTVLPATAGMAIAGRWTESLLHHLLIAAVPFIRIGGKVPQLLFIRKLIPAEHFEWVSGVRKYFYAIILPFMLAVVLSPVKLFGVAALFLLNCIFLSFYQDFEPRNMLNPNNYNLSRFLESKVTFSVKCMLLINLPLLIINSLFNPEAAGINLLFATGFALVMANVVLIKYVHYAPNESPGMNADLLILVVAIFVPYLLPLSVILYFMNRKKAITNLSVYTHDNSSDQ